MHTAGKGVAMPKDTQVSTKSTTTPPEGGRALRISAKLRTVIDLVARQGMPAAKAAAQVGMHEVSVYKAFAKPHVRAELDRAKTMFSLEINELKGTAKALAIQTGIELMRSSPSDNVRARMVEFFAGEGRQPLVNVSVSTAERGIYAYNKPRDITPPPDSASGATGRQAIEIEGKAQEAVQQGRSQVSDGSDGVP